MATVGFHAAKFSGGTVIFNDAEFSGSVGFVDAGFSGGEIRSFRRIYDRNRIIVIKVHHLRHTTASLLKRLRVAPRNAQMILGHARISTTMRIYTHVDEAARDDALASLNMLLGGGQ